MNRKFTVLHILLFWGALLLSGCAKEVVPPHDPVTGMQFVNVPGGCFEMGAVGKEDEQPPHEVCVDSFAMGAYEVTQTQWMEVMGSNPSKFKSGSRPVENVSWQDIQRFIAKLNQASGQLYRLPTEAEWEYAARGGDESKGYQYSGSNDPEDVAWYKKNSGGETLGVGHLKANELGLYDMSGNVREWCRDWYSINYYRWSEKDNPLGPDSGEYRVGRGGSWRDEPESLRVADRYPYAPAYRRSDYFGFRLVLPIEE